MVVLGIESSCDDTAAAVVADGRLLASVVSSQEEHGRFGGVVPEVASRAHQRLIVPVVEAALERAAVRLDEIEGVAVTYGPGLVGSLLVGLSFAKTLALGRGIPLIGVNHLEGHIYSVFLEERTPPFPYLCLIVSGGHTELVRIAAPFEHELLGRTRDDAAGEAFDKVAKLLGLPYPGGPEIDRLAAQGDSTFHAFPRSTPGGYDFSFSGVKTNVLYYLNRFDEAARAEHLERHLADLCASFQASIVDVLVSAIERAVQETGIRDVAIVGGVSANSGLRRAAEQAANAGGFDVYIPAPRFCGDNAAMVAEAGYRKLHAGLTSPLSLTAEPSLSL
ncbi:MAG TPA: tRNA (adenosine(37)-N6)-threonylcarbamoyltransferase complex transferase subunit TsaD [Rhodothermales bacterium]